MPYNILNEISEFKGKIHSCILLTYSLDLHFYSKVISRKLLRNGISNQMVFMDNQSYKKMIENENDIPLAMGRLYSVTPIYNCLSFHPKILLLLGKEKGKIVIGSGNATSGGFLSNWELFGDIEIQDNETEISFIKTLQLVDSFENQMPESIKRQLNFAKQNTPWLGNKIYENKEKALFINVEKNLFSQITTMISDYKPKRIIVISPFWDDEFEILKKLSIDFSDTPIDVIIQKKELNADGKKIEKLGKNIQWYEFKPPDSIKNIDIFAKSFLHAKLILYETNENDLVFFGSANMSKAAMFMNPPRGNYESVVAIIAKKGSTLKQLGLKESLDNKPITKNLYAKVKITEDIRKNEKMNICLISVEIENDICKVKILNPPKETMQIEFFNYYREKIDTQVLYFETKNNYFTASFINNLNTRLVKIKSENYESGFMVVSYTSFLMSSSESTETVKYQMAFQKLLNDDVTNSVLEIVMEISDILGENLRLNKKLRTSSSRKQDDNENIEQTKANEVDLDIKDVTDYHGHSSDLDLLLSFSA